MMLKAVNGLKHLAFALLYTIQYFYKYKIERKSVNIPPRIIKVKNKSFPQCKVKI